MRMICALVAALALLSISARSGVAAQTTGEQQALVQFQRAADTYAFRHRQVERRLGGTPDSGAMSAGVKAARLAPGEESLFTPLVASAFRSRIQMALGRGLCAGPDTSLSSIVPRPNDATTGTVGLSDCLVAALPKLPPELEYRAAGVVLLLIDVHAGIVVDVVHGAFPTRND